MVINNDTYNGRTIALRAEIMNRSTLPPDTVTPLDRQNHEFKNEKMFNFVNPAGFLVQVANRDFGPKAGLTNTSRCTTRTSRCPSWTNQRTAGP